MTINNPAYYTYRPSKLKVSRLGVNISDSKNDTLNLRSSEYMIVGEHYTRHGGMLSNAYSLIVDEEGIAVNCSQLDRWNNSNDYAVQFRGNTYIDGNLIVTGVISGTGAGTSNVPSGSSNFWRYAQDTNIYYDGKVTIGNYNESQANTYSLNIAEPANYDANRAQFAIQNMQDSEVRVGILGASSNSPIVFNTPSAVPIEFHVNRPQSYFQDIYQRSYSNYGEWITEITDTPNYDNVFEAPHLNLDIHGNVGIRTSLNPPLNYVLRKKHPTTPDTIVYTDVRDPMALHIEGSLYACNILLYDYESGYPRNIDDLYYRMSGQTVYACNLIPGTFARGTFTFQSNVSIQGPIDYDSALKIYGQTAITSNLYVDGNIVAQGDLFGQNLYVRENGSFSNNIVVQNNIYFKSNMYKQRFNPDTGSNEWSIIQFNSSMFPDSTLSNVYYIGEGLATIGRFGVGAYPTLDEVNHQHTIIKRDETIYELELMDKTVGGYNKTLYIGHPTVSSERYYDGSTVFLTPGQQDGNYNQFLSYAPQNIYFYPGYTQSISQFRLEQSNVPTFGVFVNKRVGIRTFEPTHELDVNGDIAITGNFYIKTPSDPLSPSKLAIWKDMTYSYYINGSSNTYGGIQYYNPLSPHVGVNTMAQSDYGMVVSGKLLSQQGYYTDRGYRMLPLYSTLELIGQTTPSYETMYVNGRLGMGVLRPRATLHLQEATGGPTNIRLTQSIRSPSILVEFQGDNNNYMLHANDALGTFELQHGSSNLLYSTSLNRPWITYKRPSNLYQTVINSNLAFATNNPYDALLVNGNVKVVGDMSVTGTYKINGSAIIISGSQAEYNTDNINPDNIYMAGENLYINVKNGTGETGAMYVGYEGSGIYGFPDDSGPSAPEFARSVLYLLQRSSIAPYVMKFRSKNQYCLSEYKTLSRSSIYGVTANNAIFMGRDIETPYIAVTDSFSYSAVGIGTDHTSTKLHVYTNYGAQTMAKLTHVGNTDSPDFVSDLTLQKDITGETSYQWVIQGPNSAYQQKLQFLYGTGTDTPSEIFTFTSNGSLGIGRTDPSFALDIKKMGDQGGIRLLQSDPVLAKPQLLFQSGVDQYGADSAIDYRMYSFSNNFYLDMQDIAYGQKVLYHFTSNTSLGLLQQADTRFGVSVAGTLNVRDGIYLNGEPFFTVADTVVDSGVALNGYNVYLNPQSTYYGGVAINTVHPTSNIFQINSGLNGNITVFDSSYPKSYVHFRNKENPLTRRIWRMGASNHSFIFEYRSNVSPTETLITDDETNYSQAMELLQSDQPGTYRQRFRGFVELHAPNPSLTFLDPSVSGPVPFQLGTSNNQAYLSTPSLGLGTYTPQALLHLTQSNLAPALLVQSTSASNALEILGQEGDTRLVVTPTGNLGIGTTMPQAKLEIAGGSLYLPDNSPSAPALAFSTAPQTGLYLPDPTTLSVSIEGQSIFSFTSNGLGIQTPNPTSLLHLTSSNDLPMLRLNQYGPCNILECFSGPSQIQSLTIDQNGNIGIGTTLPQFPLHIDGSFATTGDFIPGEDGTQSLGASNLRWKDLYLSGSSLYLDDMVLSHHPTSTIAVFQNEAQDLVPILAKEFHLSEDTFLTPDPASIQGLPKYQASNISYTPIVLRQDTLQTGIGTTSPSASLHLFTTLSDQPAFQITRQGASNSPHLLLDSDSFVDRNATPFQISFTHDGRQAFGTPDQARLTIRENSNLTVLSLHQDNDAGDILQLSHQSNLRTVFNKDGHLGIQTSNVLAPLHVEGQTLIRLENSNIPALSVYGMAEFSSNVTAFATMDIHGDLITRGNTINISDRRVKFNIQPIESALDKIKKISGYTFDRIQTQTKTQRETGVIAQELQEVLPEAVFEEPNGMLGVAYGNVVGLLIEGIKELSSQLEDIKKRL